MPVSVPSWSAGGSAFIATVISVVAVGAWVSEFYRIQG